MHFSLTRGVRKSLAKLPRGARHAIERRLAEGLPDARGDWPPGKICKLQFLQGAAFRMQIGCYRLAFFVNGQHEARVFAVFHRKADYGQPVLRALFLSSPPEITTAWC